MEWTAVTVVVVLVGLIASVIKPVISLNTTITRLTESVNSLQKNIASIAERNDESHARLWRRSAEHDERLSGHETRIKLIESAK